MRAKDHRVTDRVSARLCALTEGLHDQLDGSSLARLCENILPLIHNASPEADPLSMPAEQVREKMAKGEPLLFGLELVIDISALRDLMIRLAGAYVNHYNTAEKEDRETPRAVVALLIRTALEENRLDAGELLQKVISGDKKAVESAALALGLDPGLLRTIALNALKPVLRHWQRSLTPLAAGIAWDKGYCFICGSRASIGELRDDNQQKHLRCGTCGADWQYHRLQCVYCGNENHKSLGYLYPEGQHGSLRVEYCEKCRGYIKLITSFSPNSPESLDIEDIATIHLDCIARERGYINGIII